MRRTPWVLCDGEAVDLRCYHPYTMLEGLPLGDPRKNNIRKYENTIPMQNFSTTQNVTEALATHILFLLSERFEYMI